jgi:hypothetical protein
MKGRCASAEKKEVKLRRLQGRWIMDTLVGYKNFRFCFQCDEKFLEEKNVLGEITTKYGAHCKHI